MSLYNMLFGMNPDTDKLLSLLDATREDFGRFRNVYMRDGYIVVHTRCGGGNREDYFPDWVEGSKPREQWAVLLATMEALKK